MPASTLSSSRVTPAPSPSSKASLLPLRFDEIDCLFVQFFKAWHTYLSVDKSWNGGRMALLFFLFPLSS